MMRRLTGAVLIGIVLCIAPCAKSGDYRKAIVGEWDAGMAGGNSRILMTMRADGTLAAVITGTDIKPLSGTYAIEGDRISIRFPRLDMSYRIVSLDRDELVMRTLLARITWRRIR